MEYMPRKAIEIGAGRLDQLCPAPGEQVVPEPVFLAFALGDRGGEPGRQRLRVGHAALAIAGVAADLAAVPLGGPGREVIRIDLDSRHVDLSGHVGDGVVGQLVSAAGEPAPPE